MGIPQEELGELGAPLGGGRGLRGGGCGGGEEGADATGLGVEGGVMPEGVLGEKRGRKGKAGAGERAEEGGQPPLNPAAPPPSHPRPQARLTR